MTSARVGQATLRSSARTWRAYSEGPMRSFVATRAAGGRGASLRVGLPSASTWP